MDDYEASGFCQRTIPDCAAPLGCDYLSMSSLRCWKIAAARFAAWVLLPPLAMAAVTVGSCAVAEEPLRVSVYCTAGDILTYLSSAEGPTRVLDVVSRVGATRLFLEGRRGDEYVPASQLRPLREFFAAHGIQCSGGIATVPGATFGARQHGGLSWLDWESDKTRSGVAGFFRENAPVFDELIVDDFYCTGDTSAEAEKAKGNRSWGEYRRTLLVSLLQPLIIDPTRKARPQTQLIIKFPQWYDRFQEFGYDPLRMAPHFDQVWVGTEVRNPETRRMGFVQPTEGYVNFQWITSQAGKKVRGAWFDHIECSAQQFLDQACQSVLAGARELTLFHLGDLMDGHPGDALLAERLPQLINLAERLRAEPRHGVAFYKPPASNGQENLYLADYLAMIGWPILPQSSYPGQARVAFLPAQAAADPNLLKKMRDHLNKGATLIATPALVRAIGQDAAKLAGVSVAPKSVPGQTLRCRASGETISLNHPLDLDSAFEARGAEVLITANVEGREVPLLTRRSSGKGKLWVLNVRTFSEQDFLDEKEWLLAPRQLGLPRLPQALADRLRAVVLKPLGEDLSAPSGVEFLLFGKVRCLYSFRDEAVRVVTGGRSLELAAHQWLVY